MALVETNILNGGEKDENFNEIRRKNKGLFTVYLRTCEEECDFLNTTVKGTIPVWLNGCLLRNGPGKQRLGPDEYKHMFDGLALMRKYHIENGNVVYQSKFLRSKTYRQNMEAQRIVVTEFGTRSIADPCKSIFGRLMTTFTLSELFSDNNLVNFMRVGDQIFALGESPYLCKIDVDTLDVTENVDMKDFVAVNTSTAHPHYDEEGNVYNIGSNFGSYNIVKISSSGGLESASIVATIPASRPWCPGYYHSFCMTPHYIIFIEQPLVISLPSVFKEQLSGGTNSNIIKWKPHYKTRFFVISRKDGKILPQRYISEAFAFFHTINAYEDGAHIVMDICCYADGNVLKSLYVSAMKDAENDTLEAQKHASYISSRARRFVIPLVSSMDELYIGHNLNSLWYTTALAYFNGNDAIMCVPECLTRTAAAMAEMPSINYKYYNGKKYRYFYGICRREDLLLQLIKCDTVTKDVFYWSEENHYPSEPVFVPRPGAIDEDDGVVLSSVISEVDECDGFLVILDGKTFKEIGRACVRTPSAQTADFHGMFLSDFER